MASGDNGSHEGWEETGDDLSEFLEDGYTEFTYRLVPTYDFSRELLDKVEILSEDTADNPTAVPLVAHNAGFDSRCLREVFRCYRMDYPEFVFHDTLAASKKYFQGNLENHQLQTVAAACGYDLTNHHHALSDAEACAWIAREIL